MIRAYQVKRTASPAPGWRADAGPGRVSEAWCHQRGYVCFIEELHGRHVKAGESFGAAYVGRLVRRHQCDGKVYDRYKGKTRIRIQGGTFTLE